MNNNESNEWYHFLNIKDPHMKFSFMDKIRIQGDKQIAAKFEFIDNYAESNNIMHINATGDFFDKETGKWKLSHLLANEEKLDILKFNSYNQARWITTNKGNHDQVNGLQISTETGAKGTVFDYFIKHNYLNYISEIPFINDFCVIQGIDYNSNRVFIESQLEEFNKKDYPDKCKIVVLHCNITPEAESKSTFTYDMLKDYYPDIDMFICGHYHIGFPTQCLARPNGKLAYFVNNWNLTRVVRDYKVTMDEHSVNMEHIKIGPIVEDSITGVRQRQIVCESILIPHLLYEDAFNLKQIDLLKRNKEEVFKFFEEIDLSDIKDSIKNDDELLDKFRDQKELKETIMKNLNCSEDEAKVVLDEAIINCHKYLEY